MPAEVLAGYLGGDRMLTLTRTARRIIGLHAADYDAAVTALIARRAGYVMGVLASDFDAEAVARSIERHRTARSTVMLDRIVSRLANDQALPH